MIRLFWNLALLAAKDRVRDGMGQGIMGNRGIERE